jgi:hypothetical protein
MVTGSLDTNLHHDFEDNGDGGPYIHVCEFKLLPGHFPRSHSKLPPESGDFVNDPSAGLHDDADASDPHP